MTGLYVLLAVYAVVAASAIGACLVTMALQLTTGRHRAARPPVLATAWADISDGFWNGLDLLIYGRNA